MSSPSNARVPTTPKAHTSLRLFASRPFACSELMYKGERQPWKVRKLLSGRIVTLRVFLEHRKHIVLPVALFTFYVVNPPLWHAPLRRFAASRRTFT